MIQNIKGYSYNDLTLVPAEISDISSRSECNPFTSDTWLPIFTAPMASVVGVDNLDKFINNGIIPILPRNIDIEIRKQEMNNQQWVALSMKEFEDLFINNYLDRIDDFIYSDTEEELYKDFEYILMNENFSWRYYD